MNILAWLCGISEPAPSNGKCASPGHCDEPGSTDPLNDTQTIEVALAASKKEMETAKAVVEEKASEVRRKADTLIRKKTESQKKV